MRSRTWSTRCCCSATGTPPITNSARPWTPTGWRTSKYLACYRGWLSALRGDTPTAGAVLAGLGDLRASEDPQDKAAISIVEAFTAAARGQSADALRHARATLAHAGALGIGHEYLRWAWPLAARAAHDLRRHRHHRASCSPCSTATSPGNWPRCSEPNATWPAPASPPPTATRPPQAFAAAIAGLRQHSTPYHLAHGLLDHAAHLLRTGDDGAAAAATGEAAGIAERLGCQPLLDRAETIQPARPRTAAS